MVQWATATQRIQHETQHDGARVHVHLCRDIMIDEADEAQLVGIRFDNRQMLDGVHCDLRRYPRHGSLPRSTLAACDYLGTSILLWLWPLRGQNAIRKKNDPPK